MNPGVLRRHPSRNWRSAITRKPQPDSDQAPVVQRIRIQYAKRGPMRFTSHRDFARAFERAVRRAGVPIAYSQGFTPHPKISYASAAPTGTASEAEYLEIGLQAPMDPARLCTALDAALSAGLDIVAAVESTTGPGLAERIDASRWRLELDGVTEPAAEVAVAAFLAADEIMVSRMTKQGRRTFDVRAAVTELLVRGYPPTPAPSAVGVGPCAILDLVVRQVTPTVRPDDVLAGLNVVADLEPTAPSKATRLAQGMLTRQGVIVDPLFAVPEGTIKETRPARADTAG
jgi:radical SAM-linked protein